MATIGSFTIYDYVVLFSTFCVTISIGVFFACRSANNVDQYFLANRKLSILPATLSLVVTYQSSLLIIGIPAETYAYGLIFGYRVLGYFISTLFAIVFVIPVFHPLKITSVYTYFKMRYQGNTVRYLALTMGTVYLIVYMGSVTFGTCIALELLVGIPYWGTILMYTIITAVYTSVGGMKAVIWSDTLQMIIMTTGVLAVIIKCVMNLGGMEHLFEYGSTRFNMNDFRVDPTVRYQFWNVVFVPFAYNLVSTYNQPGIQRIRSMPTINSARITFGLAGLIKAVVTFLVCFEGVAIYAYYSYKACDPLASGRIDSYNQLIPLTIADFFSSIPGLSGLFIAALSSAALSTLSSCLNSLVAMTYAEVILVLFPNLPQKTATNVSRAFVFVFGIVAMCITFIISVLPGSILKIFFVLVSCIDGPTCALFIISTFSRRATTSGVVIGTITGMLVTLVFSIGQILLSVPSTDELPPASISGCSVNVLNTTDAPTKNFVNSTSTFLSNATSIPETDQHSFFQKLFSISFQYFSMIGFIVSLITSYLVSLCTKSLGNIDESCLFSFRKHVLQDTFGYPQVDNRDTALKQDTEEAMKFLTTIGNNPDQREDVKGV